jgi:hypothetical protein
MQDFIDLEGASGAIYRFRRWAAGAGHLPMAGNYVVVRQRPEGLAIVSIAASDDLSQARDEAAKVLRDGGELFTRLNVGRSTRLAEHEDLSAHHQPTRQRQAAR